MTFGLSFQQQFSILLAETRTHSLRALAREIGVGQQTLRSLLHGESASPRLDIALKICRHFSISLDYFGLDDETACRQYIARIKGASSLDALSRLTADLSPAARNDALAVAEWLRRVRISEE
jgi:transcriptional regulator with XRE-family HTH domain